MAKLDFKNRWVLVTGSSSGLGREISLKLAKQYKANLIIAARRKKNLEQLKEEIQSSGETRVEIIVVDLSISENADKLFKKSIAIGPVYALINNAGVTSYGKCRSDKIDRYEKILKVNFIAAMKLSLLFLGYFEKKKEGAILNISSQGAFIPVPYQNVYSASKSALQSFTESLKEENRNSGVHICSYAPGGIDTEMFSKSGLDKNVPNSGIFVMGAGVAADKAIKAFRRGKVLSIPGLVNKLMYLLMKWMPRRWVIRYAERIYKPNHMLPENED